MYKLIIAFLLCGTSLSAFEQLSNDYCITFGYDEAPFEITQYFSLVCPHCVALYRQDFKEIKEKYIDTKKMRYKFHPVPMDILTVQAMDCLQKLSNREKQLFLDVLLDELDMDHPEISTLMMKKAMEIFKKPIDNLDDESYLEKTEAFAKAFEFIKQEDRVTQIPSLEVEGRRVNKAPDLNFITLMMSNIFPEEAYER